ncbi:M1 family aminopeptidase [Chitinophaga pollutisoli]|uniref:M1 family aminopeptidase n=1 Tax=Chitinophaga pollutisoli TaxID=3133966 RepID=A0ABZ2YUY2_9BACT
MANQFIRIALLLAACAAGKEAGAQQVPGGSYDPVAAFAPLPHPAATATRGASGKPGPAYWQNRADYKVAVSIDTLSREVKAHCAMAYTNNSPDTLTYLWLTAVQNRFRRDSRETLLTPPKGSRFGINDHTEGLEIASIKAGNRNATYSLTHNYIRVDLPQPLLPGRQVKLETDYKFILPLNGSDNMGVLKTAAGSVFQYTGVFPRVCVYDDLRGWNVSGTQYYVECGSTEMHFTAPANMIVQGTGLLLNPEDVLRPEVLRKYRQSLKSDTVIRVRSAGEAFSPSSAASLTWKFREPNAGDGGWSASASFNWEGLATRLTNGTAIPTMALFPTGSNREWDTIIRAMPRMLKAYSDQWSPYPYAAAINIATGVTGLASPGVSFIHYQHSSYAASVWIKTNHELGHAWFNLMIAADSRHGWMCEGQNTFINLVNAATLNGSVPFDMQTSFSWMNMKKPHVPVSTLFGSVPPADMGPLMYMKPGTAFLLLRNEVLGPGRFDPAFREYMRAWAFKHPAPHDFFRIMENGTGEDLAWFWRAWFLTDARMDQGITKVAYDGDKPDKGVLISIINKRQMPMPVDILVREFNGKQHRVKLPVQVWEWSDAHTLKVPTTTAVVSVQLDPESLLPDADRADNIWTGSGTKLRNGQMSAQQVIDRYFDVIGGKQNAERLGSLVLEYRSWAHSEFVLRQRFEAGGDFSWISGLEVEKNMTALKKLEQTDSLRFALLGAGQALNATQQEQLRISAMLFPELRFFETGNKVKLSDDFQLIHGMEAYMVTVVTPSGNSWRFYYDAATGLKVRQEYTGMMPSLLYSSKVLAGYDSVFGVKIPRQVTIQAPGESEELFELKNFSKS